MPDASKLCRTPQGVRGLKFGAALAQRFRARSHPARGAWIEISSRRRWFSCCCSRTPQGVRGLKFPWPRFWGSGRSRTPQGVRGLKWPIVEHTVGRAAGRTPQGVRGLKSSTCTWSLPLFRRTPQGVRGLKWCCDCAEIAALMSHPARGAWIEIQGGGICLKWCFVAPRKGCVD